MRSFEEQYASTGSNIAGAASRKMTSFQLSVERAKSGALLEVLTVLKKHNINLEHISSREVNFESRPEFVSLFFDITETMDKPHVKSAFAELKNLCPHITVYGSHEIPWYPVCAADLDRLDNKTLAAGAELADDPANPHPGFHDAEYKAARREIAKSCDNYRHGQKITPVKYSEKDIATWGVVWDKLTALYPTHACRQYNNVFPLLVENAGYRRGQIPQLQQVSDYLQDATGFTMRPVAGLLSSRDFLNALAFRCFCSTQYIRHPSKPLYTPEPDVIHELMGHVPLFADPDFASFSQEIGLRSLGASDAAIEKLARCYWYTVEFGLIKEGSRRKACGAGLLSSFGELEHSVNGSPDFTSEYRPWDPDEAAKLPFPITKYQPVYFVASNFQDMKTKLVDWCNSSLDQPFHVEFNVGSGKVKTFAKRAW